MKQSIQLRLGQHLTMTPQLQQAIRLLQLSTLDLKVEIQEALESNPLLDVDEDSDHDDSADSAGGDGNSGDGNGDANEAQESVAVDEATITSGEAMESNAIPEDLPVDSAWEDTYDIPVVSRQSADADFKEFETQEDVAGNLQDHLLWQVGLTPFSDTDRLIAEAIVDGIDEQGYFHVPLEEIAANFTELEVEIDEVEAVLRRIQHLEPNGVGARDLQECLTIQLYMLPAETPLLAQAKTLVEKYLHILAGREYNQLMRKMRCSEEALQEIVLFIQTLDPRPGSQISNRKPEYIVPDVMVTKVAGRWRVELNPETAPKLRIHAGYASMIRRNNNSADNVFLKNHLMEARWFIKSLQSRNETLLKVSKCIVEKQKGFLEYGDEAMKAMVLSDVAKEIDMHESTISRVTTKKYMHTLRGIFELKYFFSSHVSTAEGGECSATAIRAIIKKLVAAENMRKPLSDSAIASVLQQQGINVARRTVAKYRESIAIPSSTERKRLV